MDYLFTESPYCADRLGEILLDYVANKDDCYFEVWEGDWGSLAVAGLPYPGFSPVADNGNITVVLGGPVFRKGCSTEREKGATRFSSKIQHDWKKGTLNWLEDLTGGFQFLNVDRTNGAVTVVTDAGGFVPLYGFQAQSEDCSGREWCSFGSHADALARASNSHLAIDVVSVADFLMYQTVTFPATFYRSVEQMTPGTVHTLVPGKKVSTATYFQPEENGEKIEFETSATALREIFVENVEACSRHGSPTLLMSGGEDSRAVLAAAPSPSRVCAFTVADSYNREAKVAEKVTQKLGASWHLQKRSETHYLDGLERSLKLCESHNFFYHGHFNGFEQAIGLNGPVLGGLMSDAFCKGSHVESEKTWGVAHSIKSEHWRHVGTRKLLDPGTDIEQAVEARRDQWNRTLQEMRPESWAEWHTLYPATMNTDATNYLINRRLFYSYEPFADGAIIRWSAIQPGAWKINRKLFQKAMGPLLAKTRFIRHGKGVFPAFGLYVNAPVSVYLDFWKRLVAKINRRLGKPMKNEGPWPVWRRVVNTELYKTMSRFDNTEEEERAEEILGADLFQLLQRALAHNDPIQALAALQVRVWLRQVIKNRD